MQAQAVNNIEALKYLLHVPNIKSREQLKQAYEKDIDYRTEVWVIWSIDVQSKKSKKPVVMVPVPNIKSRQVLKKRMRKTLIIEQKLQSLGV